MVVSIFASRRTASTSVDMNEDAVRLSRVHLFRLICQLEEFHSPNCDVTPHIRRDRQLSLGAETISA